MAKRRRHTSPPSKRAVQSSPNRRLLTVPRLPVLRKVEDFRITSFPLTRARAYRLLTAAPVRPISTPYRSLYPRSASLHRTVSTLPKQAIVCLKRSRRREVLFALGHGGRRGRQSRHRRSETSNIHCR